jgi:hypothetical protein
MNMERVRPWAEALTGARATMCMHCGRPTIEIPGTGQTRCSRCATWEVSAE